MPNQTSKKKLIQQVQAELMRLFSDYTDDETVLCAVEQVGSNFAESFMMDSCEYHYDKIDAGAVAVEYLALQVINTKAIEAEYFANDVKWWQKLLNLHSYMQARRAIRQFHKIAYIIVAESSQTHSA